MVLVGAVGGEGGESTWMMVLWSAREMLVLRLQHTCAMESARAWAPCAPMCPVGPPAPETLHQTILGRTWFSVPGGLGVGCLQGL